MENFSLILRPSNKITFPKPIPGFETSENHLFLKNIGNERVAVKIKSSCNTMFRSSPVFISLDAGEARIIRLIYFTKNDIPDDGKHRFSIYIVPSPESESLREAFASEKGKSALKKNLQIYFQKQYNDNTVEKITDLYNNNS
uniref:Major sperm protein n=1 Tax=Strongyloides stercoralis TaxID=6248 RepID=A0AAF5CR17_STRER